jgi:hypothetical protein
MPGGHPRTMKILNLISSHLLAALSACAARWGRIKVASGSESLWLGEGWTLGSPLTLPSPTRGEGNIVYFLANSGDFLGSNLLVSERFGLLEFDDVRLRVLEDSSLIVS